VLAAGLLAAGTMLIGGRPLGRSLSRLCAGGLMFLGLVDLTFNLLNGVYLDLLGGGLMVGAINLWCLGLGVMLAAAFAPTLRAAARGAGPAPAAEGRGPMLASGAGE
jgi:hypothetical protein